MKLSELVRISWLSAFLGPLMFTILTAIAIINYPGYSPFNNFVSDLGVGGSSAAFFNSGLIFAGVCGMVLAVTAYEILTSHKKLIGILALFSAISLTGIGVFPENYGHIHLAIAVLFFGLAGISLLVLAYTFKNSTAFSRLSAIAALLVLALGSIGLTDRPFFEHLAVAIIMLWSITIGFIIRHITNNVS